MGQDAPSHGGMPEGTRLRIAVVGDFDGVHARSWLRWFVDGGHDVHAISFYAPATPLDGPTLHVLRQRPSASTTRTSATGASTSRVPRGVVRIAHGARYQLAGLRQVLRTIEPDVLHGHFIVEHGFYAALAGFHPYVVTAWGSDVLAEPERDPVSRLIAKWTLRHADLITSNNRYMADRMRTLAGPDAWIELVTLGADRYFLEQREQSVNVLPPDAARTQVVLSTRAHEPLYNIGEVISAYADVVRTRPDVRLMVAHAGSMTEALTRQSRSSPGRSEFIGFVDAAALRDAMTAADVFVSVPSSDGTSVALMQAMAAGAFPIVSDLPSQRELIDDGVNGLRVPLHRPDLLAAAIRRALADDGLRHRAAAINRGIVETRGLNDVQMLRMEALYRELVRRSPPPQV